MTSGADIAGQSKRTTGLQQQECVDTSARSPALPVPRVGATRSRQPASVSHDSSRPWDLLSPRQCHPSTSRLSSGHHSKPTTRPRQDLLNVPLKARGRPEIHVMNAPDARLAQAGAVVSTANRVHPGCMRTGSAPQVPGDRHPDSELTQAVSAVAARLGIAPATLRTWDRRYGLGPSQHTTGRHRRGGPRQASRPADGRTRPAGVPARSGQWGGSCTGASGSSA